MRDLLVTLIVFGAIPFIFYRAHIGVYIWTWLSYMNPHRLTWGFAYNMPFAAVTAGVLMLALLFSKERKKVPWNAITITWIIFVFWMCVTTFFALAPDKAGFEFERMIKIQLITLITLILINARMKIHILVWVVAMSVGFFGIKGGVFTVLSGGSFKVWGPPGTFFEGNNELALALIMVLPLMRYLQLQTKNKYIKLALMFAMISTAFSILGSYSRGAFLAGTVMTLMIWWKSKYKVVSGVLLAVVVAGLLVFMPQQWFDRMNTIETYEEDRSAMGRINSWWFAFNLATDRPFLGGGFNVFSRLTIFEQYAPDPEAVHDAHSIYFEVMGEQGFFGLTLFLLIWFFTFMAGRKVIKLTKGNDEYQWASDLAMMLQVSLVGYLVAGAFLGLAYFDLPYLIMALMVAVKVLVEKELEVDKSDGGKFKRKSEVRLRAREDK